MLRSRRIFLLVLILFVDLPVAFAQEPPDRKFLFLEDRRKKEVEEQRKREQRVKQDLARRQQRQGNLPFDINAESIDYDSKGETVTARGDVSLYYSSTLVEADRGSFSIPKNEAEVAGDVRITDVAGDLVAEEARLNLKSGAASLRNAEVDFSQGQFRVFAGSVDRNDKEKYEFENAALTTCKCPEGDECMPWQLSASRAEVTKDGYGKVWNATLDVYDTPVLYLPYLIFPAKTSRQTGLLPATAGFGRDSEFQLELPFFWAISRSADWTITPFIQTKTRQGVRNEIRKVFSERHNLLFGVLYSDEKERGDDLFGTDVSELFDPSIDENRIAAWLDHTANFEIGSANFQYIADGGFVSDDLTLRELDLPEIGESSNRFVTSQVLLRAPFWDTYSAELSAEYNQALVVDDDTVFHRLPEFSINGFDVFRPFGENPFGFKSVLRSQFAATRFDRGRDYDGSRIEIFEEISFPFYFKSYFDASVNFDVRASSYSLDSAPELVVAADGEELTEEEVLDNEDRLGIADSSSRLVPGIGGSLSTVVEKVFDVSEDSALRKIVELGSIGREEKLARLQHSVQPILSYRYVPFVDQAENPIFDSLDRLERQNVASWKLVQRFTARYEPRDEYLFGYESIAPELEDLESLRSEGPVDPGLTFGTQFSADNNFQRIRRGSKVELAYLSLGQSYDIDEELNNRSPDEEPFSDLNIDLVLNPNGHVKLRGTTNIDVYDADFSSYSVQTQLVDRRGDELRAQLRFIDDSVRQIEAGFQLVATENIKFGYYGRYDDLNKEFLENKFGMRLSSKCNCWVFDIEVLDRVNPNNTTLAFTFTLIGIGELGSEFLSFEDDERL